MSNEILSVAGTDDAELEAANMMMAEACCSALMKWYPGHFWAINADIRGGQIVVFNMHISQTHGYILNVDDWLQQHAVTKALMVAGGEILERHGMPRGKFDADIYATLPRNFMGEVIPSKE